ncbi:hypothetical protein SAMN04489761_2582 [Tenacibaculum sp. MAR_2009_124]|nr:hypothetical protein SAMN04489761_2582 [Tenacibaculum sp. MAR_2009_124]
MPNNNKKLPLTLQKCNVLKLNKNQSSTKKKSRSFFFSFYKPISKIDLIDES